MRLNFDLVTGFSVVPLQLFSMLGFFVSLLGLVFFGIIAYRRIFLGPEAEGLFTLFAINFLLLGVALFGIGLLGEYVGRIYQQVRERPRYIVQAVLEQRDESGVRSEEQGRLCTRGACTPRRYTSFALMRAVVFAYHNVGCRCLSVLLAHGVEVALVVTHDDNPTETIWFDSVERLAELARFARGQTSRSEHRGVRSAGCARWRRTSCSPSTTATCSRPRCSRSPPRGALNMHGSLLPRYRGRVPVNWAVLHGERETGATLHYMVDKPDAGDIVAQQAVPILPEDTAVEVFNKVTVAAELSLDRALPALLAGTAPRMPQDLSRGSYFGGRRPEDGRIDWSQPAAAIHNLVRAVAPPYPGAFTQVAGPDGALSAHPAAAGPARTLRTPGALLRIGPLLCRMRRRRGAAHPLPRGGRYNAVRRDLSACR